MRSAGGRFEGDALEQHLGNVQLVSPDGMQVQLFADFTDVGSRGMLAQVFGRGRLVGTVALPPG